ncbi:SMARCAL1 family protein [Megaselia abdita]
MSCTAADIAEKKRLAQEKLRQKQQQKQTKLKSSVFPAKSENNNSQNHGSKFLNSLKSLPPIPANFRNHPYQRPPSNVNRFSKSPVQKKEPETFYTKPQKPPEISPTRSVIKNTLLEDCAAQQVPSSFMTVKCSFSGFSKDRFSVTSSTFHAKLTEVFKSTPQKAYDPSDKSWNFPIQQYEQLLEKVNAMKPYIIPEPIPKNVLKLLQKQDEEYNYECLNSLDPAMFDKLLPFQKDSVCFAINRRGRVFLADEMGLGKTYQAIAIADFYREDLPMLIVTTASTKDSWANHVRELMPYINCQQIVSLTSKDQYFGDCKVLITSYNMMERHIEKLVERSFGILIFDESHNLKNPKAKCTVHADRISRKSRHVIMLSGTPALSRPVELYSQLQMLDRSFMTYKDYTLRYCEGKQSSYGWDANGQCNLKELKVVLEKKFMIRRVKSDVIKLGEKSRETVALSPDHLWRDGKDSTEMENCADKFLHSKGREREELLLQFYSKTAEIKANAVCAYLKSLVKEKKKFIVFAHHKVMMTAITNFLYKHNVDFIRIDGQTKTDLRAGYVNRFQTSDSCKVALLSLKACNAGITLTAAQTLVFAELDWNPSTLAQAESRAHRIGQEGEVKCIYLLAHKTADDIIWKMLQTKQDVLNKAGLFCEDLGNAQHSVAPIAVSFL